MKSSTVKVVKSEESFKRDVCARIQHFTTQRKMTRADLSRATGLSYRIIHEIMHGEGNPRDATIGKIAEALGVRVEELTGRSTGAYPDARSTPMIARDEHAHAVPGDVPAFTVERCILCLAQQFDVDADVLRQAIMECVMRSKLRKEGSEK